MMRIKEAILRKKLIHELNDEWKDETEGETILFSPALSLLWPTREYRKWREPPALFTYSLIGQRIKRANALRRVDDFENANSAAKKFVNVVQSAFEANGEL